MTPTLALTLTLTQTLYNPDPANSKPKPKPKPMPKPSPKPKPNPAPDPVTRCARTSFCRGKKLVLPILSSTAPLDLSSETRLMCEPGNYEPGGGWAPAPRLA